jgi:two-component system LytT family response regulator
MMKNETLGFIQSIEHEQLALPIADGFVFVRIKQIMYCEASNNYTFFFMTDGSKHLVSRTLKEYESILMKHGFFRIHHSYLVNLNYIRRYVRGDGGYVVMANEKALNVSRRKREGFLFRIGVGR